MAPAVRDMVRSCQAQLTVMHSFNMVHDHNLADLPEPKSIREERHIPYEAGVTDVRDRELRRLRDFAEEHFAGFPCTVTMKDGDPATVIRLLAECGDTDLIMIPTSGMGKFRRLLLGSVAAKVLHDVNCAVFTSAHECDPGRAHHHGYRTVVCAIEWNKEADTVLQTAVWFAQLHAARLLILHADNDPNPPPEFEVILRRSAGAAPLRILDAKVARGIRAFATDELADLVIVGRGKAQGAVSGFSSDLYEIIRECPCPVLSI
jgi:nucleotide-binding universal stress UspA family protein